MRRAGLPTIAPGGRRRDRQARASYGSFAQWCAAHPGERCVVWVGASLSYELLPDAGLRLDGARARLAWARRVLVHYHGAGADTWPLAAWRGAASGISALRE